MTSLSRNAFGHAHAAYTSKSPFTGSLQGYKGKLSAGTVNTDNQLRRIRQSGTMPDDLPDASSESIAQHCVTKAFRNRQTEPKFGIIRFANAKTQPIPKEARSFFKNTLKLGMSS